MINKNLDRDLLHYGIRQEDMRVVAQVCVDYDIDLDWLQEYVLKPCQTARSGNTLEEKEIAKILRKALDKLPPNINNL